MNLDDDEGESENYNGDMIVHFVLVFSGYMCLPVFFAITFVCSEIYNANLCIGS